MARSRDASAESGAEKLRRSHDRPDDGETAEAHNELTQPDHSKGRPPPGRDRAGNKRPSNAGNDGP